jgi:hypothetical protein
MSGQRSTSAAGHVSLEVGQPFNPFGLFNGIFIPEALVRARGISLGAKITYGRLARYAGEDGNCYPSVPTLAFEIGTCERQTQRYLAELEKKQFIRRLPRVSESGGAHLADRVGRPPEFPERWGWRKSGTRTWRPQGARIGWVAGDDVFLGQRSVMKWPNGWLAPSACRSALRRCVIACGNTACWPA